MTIKKHTHHWIFLCVWTNSKWNACTAVNRLLPTFIWQHNSRIPQKLHAGLIDWVATPYCPTVAENNYTSEHFQTSQSTQREAFEVHIISDRLEQKQKAIILLSWRVHDLCPKTQFEEQRSEISSKSSEQWSIRTSKQDGTASEPNQTRRFKCQCNSSHDLSQRVTLHDIFMLFSAIHLDMEMQAC